MNKTVTTLELVAKKIAGDKIVMVTAYDATFASILDQTGVDALLVGDSLGMVIQGQPNTLPVTLEHMIYHTQAVSRGTKRAHIVGDMPFMSYQVSTEQAVQSAGRLVQEGGAHAVKLEGGREVAESVARIVTAGIPVMGHLGLTPQSVHKLGGFRVQGRDDETAARLREDARILEQAGCYSIVLESIPTELAADITHMLHIPTIGIGAGVHCDGQVLVCYDLLGMNPTFRPKFLKVYENLFEHIDHATSAFADEVRAGSFPREEHTFHARSSRQARAEVPTSSDDGVYGTPV
ncbi:MAG: 3-methyl-2-oxobutanoate hydroxymethyltransferase [Myxococcota bacterium]